MTVNQTVQISPSPNPGMIAVSGYVTDFEARDMYGGPEAGGWRQHIDRIVLAAAVDSNPDMALLLNSEGPPLASTRTGSLTLLVDDTGLKIQAQVPASEASRIRGGRLGYSFRVKREEWDGALENRIIHELSLDKGEIGITSEAAARRLSELVRQRDSGR